MPHPRIRLYGAYVFTKATAWYIADENPNHAPGVELKVEGNKKQCVALPPRHGGVDEDDAKIFATVANLPTRLGGGISYMGICFGLTSAWIIHFLHHHVAGSFVEFGDVLSGSLRHQGAYLQVNYYNPEGEGEMPSNPEAIFTKYLGASHAQRHIELINRKTVRQLTSGHFPNGLSCWSAFVSFGGHAVGVGHRNDAWPNISHFIMDPNAGLFGYPNANDCAEDLTHLHQTFNAFRNKSHSLKAYFFKLDAG